MIRGYTTFSGVSLKVSYSVSGTNPVATPAVFYRNHDGPGSSTVNLVFPGQVYTRETFTVTLADFTSSPGYPIEQLSYGVSKDSPPYGPFLGSEVCFIRGKTSDIQRLNGMQCRIQEPGIYTVSLSYFMKVFSWRNNTLREGLRSPTSFDGIRLSANPSLQSAYGVTSIGLVKYKLKVLPNPQSDTNTKPIAIADFPANVTIGAQVKFDGSRSTDLDGAIVFVRWHSKSRTPNLGGLNIKPSNNIISYTGPIRVPATWDVSLTLGDDQGARTTITKPIVFTGNTTQQPSLPPVAIIRTYPGLGGSTTLDASNSYSIVNTIIGTKWEFIRRQGSNTAACNTPRSGSGTKVVSIPKTAIILDPFNSRTDTRTLLPDSYNFYFTITDNGIRADGASDPVTGQLLPNSSTACVNLIVN